jgi:hypothetical protein
MGKLLASFERLYLTGFKNLSGMSGCYESQNLRRAKDNNEFKHNLGLRRKKNVNLP